MISLWNANMAEIFSPGWACCLDESMSIWFNRYTCPGWVFCPRKPHPWGNEYHTIGCGVCGIMFGIEMVEGEHAPKIPADPTNEKGNTIGLLLRLCQSIYNSGRVVILDSGFCVLQGLIELRKLGVYASAIIKKRRYWPKHVPGKAMDKRMESKNIGEVDCIQGKLDNTDYNLLMMKEPDFTMKMMATYGALNPYPGERDSKRYVTGSDGKKSTTTFKYTEPYSNHYGFRHTIDDHNNLRHQVPSIEGTWITQRWPIRVLGFLLVISEVNAYLAFRHFVWHTPEESVPLRTFRRRLALALIDNEYLIDQLEQRKSKRLRAMEDNLHVMESAPPHAKGFFNGRGKKRSKIQISTIHLPRLQMHQEDTQLLLMSSRSLVVPRMPCQTRY